MDTRRNPQHLRFAVVGKRKQNVEVARGNTVEFFYTLQGQQGLHRITRDHASRQVQAEVKNAKEKHPTSHRLRHKIVGSVRGHAPEETDRANAALSPMDSGFLGTDPKTHRIGTRRSSRCDSGGSPSRVNGCDTVVVFRVDGLFFPNSVPYHPPPSQTTLTTQRREDVPQASMKRHPGHQRARETRRRLCPHLCPRQ